MGLEERGGWGVSSSMFQITIGTSTENVLVSVVWLCFLEQNKEVQGLSEALPQKKAKMNDKLGCGVHRDYTVPLCSRYRLLQSVMMNE